MNSFDADPDPDPTFHLDAVPDPVPTPSFKYSWKSEEKKWTLIYSSRVPVPVNIVLSFSSAVMGFLNFNILNSTYIELFWK